jgi:hypothetical protein
MSVRTMLNNTLSVERPVIAVAGGRSTTTYSPHLDAVPCRVYQLSGAEAMRSGAPRGVNAWRATVEPADIRRTDRLIFTDDGGVAHRVEITSVAQSGFGGSSVVLVIDGTEVKPTT